ncbi:putative motility protein [Tepidimonas thermarum]|uniref:Putative motility protein n=1 Tax=Tepidimonas thermarum TaxID=335431 RepID=A0A554WZ17_9BURK|nr:putative motility protein [Tepidimonas thermarum]TSE28813.1 putative motility protein [Tepidimonas thermarum]
MDIASNSLITQAATSAVDTPTAASILVLRKAMQVQQQSALALLQAVPAPAPAATPTGPLPLATEGPLGTRLNVMA